MLSSNHDREHRSNHLAANCRAVIGLGLNHHMRCKLGYGEVKFCKFGTKLSHSVQVKYLGCYYLISEIESSLQTRHKFVKQTMHAYVVTTSLYTHLLPGRLTQKNSKQCRRSPDAMPTPPTSSGASHGSPPCMAPPPLGSGCCLLVE